MKESINHGINLDSGNAIEQMLALRVADAQRFRLSCSKPFSSKTVIYKEVGGWVACCLDVPRYVGRFWGCKFSTLQL
jgi:hypothetical protein